MELEVWGGAGEQGRACFFLDTGAGALLLDCGVKRAFADGQVGGYPQVDRARLGRVEAVLVTHGHEDHCAALPLLEAWTGRRLPIYLHPLAVPEVRSLCASWLKSVARAGGEAPYDAAAIDRLDLRPLKPGEMLEVAGVRVTAGTSGHTLGSVWLTLERGGRRLLYTGDWSGESLLLPAPRFPEAAEVALIDGAYGDRAFTQAQSLVEILGVVGQTLAGRGLVLMPLPRLGRSQELLLELAAALPAEVPLRVEPVILEGVDKLLAQRGELRPQAVARLEGLDRQRFEPLPAGSPLAEGPAVVMVTDAMATAGAARAAVEQLAGESRHRVLLTGHQAEGTPSQLLLEGRWPGQRAAVSSIVWKAHPDLDETRRALSGLRRPRALIVHGDPGPSEALARALATDGVSAQAMRMGTRIAI